MRDLPFEGSRAQFVRMRDCENVVSSGEDCGWGKKICEGDEWGRVLGCAGESSG